MWGMDEDEFSNKMSVSLSVSRLKVLTLIAIHLQYFIQKYEAAERLLKYIAANIVENKQLSKA